MKLSWLLPSVLGFLVSLPAEAAKLEYWRFTADKNRLDLVTDAGIQPKALLIPNPTRLVIDLPNTTFGRPDTSQRIGGKILEARAAQFDPQTTRIVIEAAPGYTLTLEQVRVRGIAPNRWFVQLPEPQPLSKERVWLAKSLPVPVPPPVQPVATRPPSSPSLPLPKPSARGVVVVVDPGHGGQDSGAVGVGGLLEKQPILAIALEVASLLEKQGINAVLTRSDDRFVDLGPRVTLAERVNAKAFVSIHANSISLSRPDVNGLETYRARDGSSSGLRLAQLVHSSILRSLNMRDRGVRSAGFYVLRNTSMPAILIEVGFVTGREDAARLASSTGRRLLAQAIAQGILQYFQ